MDFHLEQVALRNYRSIASCEVKLAPLTFMVGPNGGGKSNFLDALRFVSEALQSLGSAVQKRGGLNEIAFRGSPQKRILVRFSALAGSGHFLYSLTLVPGASGRFSVHRETLIGELDKNEPSRYEFEARNGRLIRSSVSHGFPPSTPDRLFLASAAAVFPFGVPYLALTGMRFYNLDTSEMRDVQSAGDPLSLNPNGGNLASVLEHLRSVDNDRFSRLMHFLNAVLPAIEDIQFPTLGPKQTIEFVEKTGRSGQRRLLASSMSEGTIRALGVLTALFQRGPEDFRESLVGIEEPETALHPAAAGVLFDALRETSERRQVIVTSHSPDLLDRDDVPLESILAVAMDDGNTVIAPVDKAGSNVLKRRLCTPGELMRSNQLRPAREASTQPEPAASRD